MNTTDDRDRMEAGSHAMTFGRVTWIVRGMPTVDVEGEGPCISMLDLGRAERAIVLAALADGCREPDLLRFARQALGLPVERLADECMCYPSEVRAWESGEVPIPAQHVRDLVGLLAERDPGGFVAQLVTA